MTPTLPVPGPTGSPGAPVDLPPGLVDLVPAYLGRQRWYAGEGNPEGVEVVAARTLPVTSDGGRALWWVVVDAGGDRYQLLVGQRPGGEVADWLAGHEEAVLGALDGSYYYDGALDPELSLPLLDLVSGGAVGAERVRPITAEQSNTSLVYDDRVIMKVFRKLMDGPNPDVEVTSALATGGFAQVAAPVAGWREDEVDYMFAQEFLAGGSEGWALALTSLRDYYSVDRPARPEQGAEGGGADPGAQGGVAPGESGGDFAGEARRLGRMTARMHLVLADTFGVAPLPAPGWAALVDDIAARLDALELDDTERTAAVAIVDRLRGLDAGVPALRVHGDYHLGQVMRTDTGWYVLDFEGEPARALDERVQAASPLKDVTGMLRSLHYASRFALRDRVGSGGGSGGDDLGRRAEAWEAHNRSAFLEGYHAEAGISTLLPGDPATEELVADAYELDKALYEHAYERSYRPDWVDIPLTAVRRIVSGAPGAAAG